MMVIIKNKTKPNLNQTKLNQIKTHKNKKVGKPIFCFIPSQMMVA